jgi:hypothetical protein
VLWQHNACSASRKARASLALVPPGEPADRFRAALREVRSAVCLPATADLAMTVVSGHLPPRPTDFLAVASAIQRATLLAEGHLHELANEVEQAWAGPGQAKAVLIWLDRAGSACWDGGC